MYNPQRNNNILSKKYDDKDEQSQQNYNFISDNNHLSILQKSYAELKSMREQKEFFEQKSLMELNNSHTQTNMVQSNHKSNNPHQDNCQKLQNSSPKSNIENSLVNINSSSNLSQKQNNNNNEKYLLNQEEVIIKIEGFKFQPQQFYVHRGTKLVWQVKINKSTYNSLYDQTGPRFFIVSIPQLDEESIPIHENESYSYVIDKIGTFDMTCPNYTRMKGQIIVVEKSATQSGLANELQTKGCFMGHIDEYKYSSQNQINKSKQLYINSESLNKNKQIFQQQQEKSPLYLNENFEKQENYEQVLIPLKVQNDKIFNTIENNNKSQNIISQNQNQKTSSNNNQEQSQTFKQIQDDIQIKSKNGQTLVNQITSNDKSKSSDVNLIKSEQSTNIFESNQKVKSTKQEKILTQLIDSDHQKNAESQQIAKQFMQELQDEQNNQPNKKKNTHYLQLYRDDFQEDIDEDEEDDQQNDSKKKNQVDLKKKLLNANSQKDKNNKQICHESNTEIINSSIENQKIENNIKEEDKQIQMIINIENIQVESKNQQLNQIEQNLLTPKRKNIQSKENKKYVQLNLEYINISLKNSSLSQQQIPSIQEEDNKINKKNDQIIQNKKQSKLTIDSQKYDQQKDKQSEIVLSSVICGSSSPITLDTEFQIIEDSLQNQDKLNKSNGEFKKMSSDKQNIQNLVEEKQIKNFNQSDNQKQQKDGSLNSKQNEKEKQKDGYHSDYDYGKQEDEEDEKERKTTERRKNVQLLKQGSNPNNLYFRGHNYQFMRNYQNQYKSIGMVIQDDEYNDGEEDDYQYDCSTIISEEDVSTYTSKENSLVYRRNNSSTNLQSSGSGNTQQNINPNNSFSASQTFNKQHFPKIIRRNYPKKLKIGGLSENYLKSPAQSILTTAESSKYSDTTKQLSQKGDFELEGADIHERGYLLFQHKYSQKRRASTDQTIQESRYNNNEDSDTRSLKSLKNELNIINNPNLNSNNINNSNNSTNMCGNAFGFTNTSCCIQNNVSIQNNLTFQNDENTNQQSFECHSDNESECSDLFTQYCLQTFEQNSIVQSSQKSLTSENTFSQIKQQPMIQFLNFTENINLQDKQKKNLKKQYNNSQTDQQNLKLGQENREESKSFSSQNTNKKTNDQIVQDQLPQEDKKFIEDYIINTQSIKNEVNYIQNNLPLSNEKNEPIQEQISFALSFLEQRYEIESWLALTSEDQGEIEDY